MSHYITGAVWAGLVIALMELVQATAARHLRRFGACALGGAAVAIAAGIFITVKRHKQLVASAAAAHVSVTHLLVTGMAGVAVVVTVAAYIIATWRARRGGGMGMRRRRMAAPPPGRMMLPPGGGF